jgi:TPP-dependent pyruvate/acetoin dehydrogenase alpha subunit
MTADRAIPATMAPDPVDLLRRMWRIRAFEEKASELYATGRIRGLLHLGIGQEAIAIGAATALAPGDVVFGTHRAHAHALAMGADPARVMAELAGRTTGYAGGKGGSMHLSAPATGFITATGVVGGGIPLALGAAFAAKVLERPSVAVAFFGDGAAQTGSFHESLNLASLWQLPVILFCENNGYAEFTPLSAHTNVERLASHAATYGIPAATVDGNDVRAVLAAVVDAAGRARAGGGPQFIEALTYRLRGHYEGDPARYRELAELADWRAKDPLAVLQGQLEAEGVIASDDLVVAGLQAEARAAVEAAAAEAMAGPVPSLDDLTAHVVGQEPVHG